MDGRTFRTLLSKVDSLTGEQRRLLSEKLSVEEVKSPLDVVNNTNGKPLCPHCESDQVVKNGWQDDLQCFKCKACLKRFNPLTKTPLARLRHRDKWRQAVDSIEQKNTLTQMQERLKVCRDTAHRWRHRLLKVLAKPGNTKL